MSAKNLDNKNRWRNKTVAFRMSPEEARQLDVNVKLSGLTKQDYLISRSLQQDIVVVGNPRVYKTLKTQMAQIYDELRHISDDRDISEEMLETLKLIAVTLDGLKEE